MSNEHEETELQRTLRQVFSKRRKQPVRSEEELDERLDEFFLEMYENQEIPTVEKLCLYLGLTYSVFYSWRDQGKLGVRIAIKLKQATEIIAALDAELAIKGQMTPVIYFFRATNHYGMKNANQQSAEVERIDVSEQLSTEEIRRSLEDYKLKDLPISSDIISDFPADEDD